MFLMLTKAPLDEDSKNSNRVKYVLIKKKNIYIYIYKKKKCIVILKLNFQQPLHQSGYFGNHSDMLIWKSRNINFYYYMLRIFVESAII